MNSGLSAAWLLSQMMRWGQAPRELDLRGVAEHVYRLDLYNKAAADLGWPVVLKPQSSVLVGGGAGVARFTVSYAGGPKELADRMQPYEGQCGVLLQEYYAGLGAAEDSPR